MSSPVLLVKRLRAEAEPPKYMSEGAVGLDLAACLSAPVTLGPGCRALIPTGLAVAVPSGYEAQVRPRSGLAVRHGITCLNSPGTIDPDFRGEVQVILVNHGQEPFTITTGERIAQLVVAPVARVDIELKEDLAPTQRGEGGFGSTGK